MARAGTVAVLLPGAFYFLRETRLPPIEALRGAGVRDGGRDRLQPGHVAADLAAARAEHGVHAVPPDAARGARRRHRRGGAALGLQSDIGTLEAGKRADFVLWDIERPADLAYAIGANPCRAVVRSGQFVNRGAA